MKGEKEKGRGNKENQKLELETITIVRNCFDRDQ